MKKIIKYGIILFVAFYLIGLIFGGSPNCENNTSEYQDGYTHGKIARAFGGSGCSSYINSHNNETGRNRLKATDCFCAGFDDATSRNPAKH